MIVTTMPVNDQRSLGRLEARLDAMDEHLDRIEKHLEATDASVQELLNYMSSAQGGWKALSVIGVISSALGAGLMKIFLGK